MKNTMRTFLKPELSQKIEPPTSDKSVLRSLEPRFLLDAAAVETGLDAAEKAVAEQQAEAYVSGDHSDDASQKSNELGELDALVASRAPEQSRRDEIVFLDPSVEAFQDVLLGIDPAIDVVVLNQGSDGLEQIANALKDHSQLSAIHIFANIEGEGLNLGDSQLDSTSIEEQYRDEISIIGNALQSDGDLLIYSGDFDQDDLSQSTAGSLTLAINNLLEDNPDILVDENGEDIPISIVAEYNDDVLILNLVEDEAETEDFSKIAANDDEEAPSSRPSYADIFKNRDENTSPTPLTSSNPVNFLSTTSSEFGNNLVLNLDGIGAEDDRGGLSYDEMRSKEFLESLADRKDMLKFYFDSEIHDDEILISIDSNDHYFDDMEIAAYSITLADGKPLPSSIRLGKDGVLSIDRNGELTEVELAVIAELKNGERVENKISLETSTGNLYALEQAGDEIVFAADRI